MRGAIPPLSQYAFKAWCSVKAQGQLCLYHTKEFRKLQNDKICDSYSSSITDKLVKSRKLTWRCPLNLDKRDEKLIHNLVGKLAGTWKIEGTKGY